MHRHLRWRRPVQGGQHWESGAVMTGPAGPTAPTSWAEPGAPNVEFRIGVEERVKLGTWRGELSLLPAGSIDQREFQGCSDDVLRGRLILLVFDGCSALFFL